jgi:alkanesulfonate monooxygenase SsuD/methylene tetrahydromethanopterin reductase-like flavin-dependent oxidoreductase (luciferase family)
MSDPKPVQKPHPPIWLGGDSDGAFRRIIRFADGWHGLLGGSPGARREAPTLANFAERIARLRQLSEKAGRDPGSIALSVKATTQLGPETEHPFQGPASKIVESIKQLEQMGLEFVVLAPNTGPDRTGPELLDELATQVLGACR